MRKKGKRYLLVKKVYANVKNEAHKNDPQLKTSCKKSIAYLLVCLFLK